MKGMKKFFSFLVAMIFCFCLVGCWDGDGGGGSKSEPAANEEDGTGTVIFTLAFPDSNFVADANFVDPNATGDVVVLQWREFDPRNLPEYRELPEPSADEPFATMGIGETPSRAKSSNDFYNVLRDDLLNGAAGEVRLDFYGKDPLLDIYGDYLGSRTVNAYDFFAGTAQEKVKAREYWIHAVTYCESSGYCFQADAHVIFFPNETNRVLFSFRPTGSVSIPCYIDDPDMTYRQYAGDNSCSWWIEGANAYLPQAPSYEGEKLMFTVCCNYQQMDLNKEMEMELHIQSETDLHILEFSINLLDIMRQRPLQLVAEEVPTGTIQYSGEFEFEKREIVIDSPVDGDVVNFPLTVKGTAIGMDYIVLLINNTSRSSMVFEQGTQLSSDAGENFSFLINSLDYVKSGESLKIIAYCCESDLELVSVDVVVGPVYKSFPIISQIPLTNEELKIVNGNSQAIYKWKVEASSCGNIGIKQMPRLKVAWQDLGAAQSELRLSSLRLFRGTTDITDFVEITNQDGVSVKMSALTKADNSIFIYFSPEEIIAGGATLFYTLKATPENFDSALSGSDRVAFIMLADNAPAGNKRYVYCDNGIWKLAEDISGTNAEQFNSLWSDRSEVPHSAISGMSTADWFNGYLIKNLPLSHVIMEK